MKRHIPRCKDSKIPVPFWVIGAFIWTVFKTPKGDKEVINHDKEMNNFFERILTV